MPEAMMQAFELTDDNMQCSGRGEAWAPVKGQGGEKQEFQIDPYLSTLFIYPYP